MVDVMKGFESKDPSQCGSTLILFFDLDRGERLDAFLAKKLGKPRNQIQKMIQDRFVKVNGIFPSKKSYMLRKGDKLEITIPPQIIYRLKKEDVQLEIIWENDDYIVINKPAGVVVHPSPHHTSGTIVNAILEHVDFEVSEEAMYKDLVEGRIRPGIVHRLDKDVSGVLLVAKNPQALEVASRMFRERKVRKAYIAICFGTTEKKSWEIRKGIKRSETQNKVMKVTKADEGKEAITYVKTIETNPELGVTLFELIPITGRTHQIRVHMSSEGFPILNDHMYGGTGEKLEKLWKKLGIENYDIKAIFLHAFMLEIFGKKFYARLPEHFELIASKIYGKEILDRIYSEMRT